MEVYTTLAQLQAYLRAGRRQGKTVGLVPTMGALHAGHISLIDAARRENDLVVCSIYVNPTQFNNASDLQLYPRTLEADCRMLEKAGCDVVFAPGNEVMYPSTAHLRFDFGDLERVMEGQFRPGHFNGVGLVVSKFFHMIQPDRAYFGQKDLQQFLIIQRLVRDLSFQIQLVRCPIIREEDGLAMSSRNTRLTPAQRAVAPVLYQALSKARELLLTRSIGETRGIIYQDFERIPDVRLEYFEVADGEDLRALTEIQPDRPVALCIAAFLGEVRLIDNLLLFS